MPALAERCADVLPSASVTIDARQLLADAAALEIEADGLAREARAKRGKAAALRRAAEQIKILDDSKRLHSASRPATLGSMDPSTFRPGVPGRRPSKESLVTEAARVSGLLSIPRLAKQLGIDAEALKTMHRRGRIPDDVTAQLRRVISEASKKKSP